MTLTELKYAIAVARLKHFGRAADYCHISQPSLSVAVKKLEDELGIKIFERRRGELSVTPIGQLVIDQAQKVIEEAEHIHKIAEQGKDPLSSPLRLGVIFTVAPYLIPSLVHQMLEKLPEMPLIISEDYTEKLLERLRSGELDCIIASRPFDESGLVVEDLYDEEFIAAVPQSAPIAKKGLLHRADSCREPMLLLGHGHCLRDQILAYCGSPQSDVKPRQQIEGSSLQTIMNMVEQGLGMTIIPATAAPYFRNDPLVRLIAFMPPDVPIRRISLVWRKSFPRQASLQALTEEVGRLKLQGALPIAPDANPGQQPGTMHSV